MPEINTLPRSAMNVLPLKERMKILRRHMPELDPLVRSRNFAEVNLGLNVLDAVTEAKVNAALDEVMKGRTTFVIAHRLSTIRNATRILVFDGGRVIENGTFDELVAKGGRFAELASAQFMIKPEPLHPVAREAEAAAPVMP